MNTLMPAITFDELEFPALDHEPFADTVPSQLADFQHSDMQSDVRTYASGLLNFDPVPDPLKTIKRSEPMLYNQIVATWGSPELSAAFSRWLLVDNRRFTTQAATALLRLSELHAAKFDAPTESTWDHFR